MASKRMTVLSMLESWLSLLGEPVAKANRYQWSGTALGSSAKRRVDYLFADAVTSSRAAASFYSRGNGYPSFILGTKYDLGASPKLKVARPAYKPIGWRPTHITGYDLDIGRHFDCVGPRCIPDIATAVKHIASAWTAPRPSTRRRGQAVSAMESVLRGPLRQPDLSPEQRHEAATKIWMSQGQIDRERCMSHSASVLQCLRAGGWGAPHLSPLSHLCRTWTPHMGA